MPVLEERRQGKSQNFPSSEKLQGNFGLALIRVGHLIQNKTLKNLEISFLIVG